MSFLEECAARGLFMRLLAVPMLGLGLAAGTVFPFFVMFALKLPREVVLQAGFVLACLVAGFLVGFLNYLLVRLLLARILKGLSASAERLARGDLSC